MTALAGPSFIAPVPATRNPLLEPAAPRPPIVSAGSAAHAGERATASGRPGRPVRPAPSTALLHGLSRRSSPFPAGEEVARRAAAEQGHEELRRVRSLAAVVAVACVEAEAGRRPLRDLAGWLAPEVYDKLTRRVDLLTRTGTRPSSAAAPRPLGARVCQVAPGRVEASATVVIDGRARAFALRIERRLSRWKVTSVEMG